MRGLSRSLWPDFLRADPKLAFYGLFMAYGSSFGQTYFISQFGGEIRRDFALSDAAFGTIYGSATLLSAAVIVYTGALVDRIDLRKWTFCLLTVCAVACAALGAVQGPITLFIAIFLLRQSGQGLMSHTNGHSLGRYSRVGRGKAIAFGSYGFPLGEATFPILAVTGIAILGWRETWFSLAIVYIAVGLPLALWLLRGHDVRYARYEASEDNRPTPSAAPAPQQELHPAKSARSWRRKEVLRDPRFYLVLPGMLAPSFNITGLLLHGVRIAETKGWSAELWAGSLIFYAAASIPTGILFGSFVDRFGAARGLPLMLPGSVFGCLLLGVSDATWTAAGFMILNGITAGMVSVLFVALWAESYGTRYLGEIKAMMTALMVFSSAAAPPLLGWMLDSGWSVGRIGVFCASYAAIGWVLSLFAMRGYAAART